MYLGSVKFFKHLICLVLALLIIVPIILSVIFYTKYNSLKNKTSSAPIQAKSDSVRTENDISEFCKEIKSAGYSANDILKVFENNGLPLIDTQKIFKEHFDTATAKPDYEDKFPNLYATPPVKFEQKDKTVFLTFDDGPSTNTLAVLDILDKYNIKATFFVSANIKQNCAELLKEIVKRGHKIGVHSYSHDYNKIYSDVDSFLDDFNNTYSIVYNATGVKPDIFRFAGGSINVYNRSIYQQIIAEMTRRGFVYYDWNVSGEDADKNATWTTIYNHVLKSIDGKSHAIVLLHDSSSKDTTVTVVEDLIIALQKKGYSFDKLTNNITPVTFAYTD